MNFIRSLLIKSFFTIFFVYVFLFVYTFFNYENEFKDTFKSLENLNFHEKYSKKIHHIREENSLKRIFKEANVNDLLYTTVNSLKNKKNIVLFQGDSWFQGITLKGNYNLKVIKEMIKAGEDNSIGFINAGIASYSPSLMSVQLDTLEDDFNIFPNVLIAFINQSDIGDEICRYRKNKIFKKGILYSVDPEKDISGQGWFNYQQSYIFSKVYLSKKNKFIKTFRIINSKYKYSLIRSAKRFYRQYLSTDKVSKIRLKKCYNEDMEKYLIKPTVNDINYFKSSINEYLNKIKQKQHIKKLILVSFPSKNHFKDKYNSKTIYNFNVSDTIDDIIKNRENIKHINFSKILLNNKNFKEKENIWRDDNIHLKPKYYSNLFLKKILSELLENIL
jgi:hypothetical protein